MEWLMYIDWELSAGADASPYGRRLGALSQGCCEGGGGGGAWCLPPWPLVGACGLSCGAPGMWEHDFGAFVLQIIHFCSFSEHGGQSWKSW